MEVGNSVPLPPLGKGVKDGVVNIADYESKQWPMVPIAIPSKGREGTLCEQTLQMLQSYGYDLAKVHVFVDATHITEDGWHENDVYFL